MRISKWVDMGAEVEIQIGIEDIRGALAECFVEALEDPLGEPRDSRDVVRAYGQIGSFLKAVSDGQIAKLNVAQRAVMYKFLTEQSARYA